MIQHNRTATGAFDDCLSPPSNSKPSERPLRVLTFDPSGGRLTGSSMNAYVRCEFLEPGPIGGRLSATTAATRRFTLQSTLMIRTSWCVAAWIPANLIPVFINRWSMPWRARPPAGAWNFIRPFSRQ